MTRVINLENLLAGRVSAAEKAKMKEESMLASSHAHEY
jgi:hypothetical protein